MWSTCALIQDQASATATPRHQSRDGRWLSLELVSRLGVWGCGGGEGVLAQARHGCQHKLDASSFVEQCLSEPQWGRVSMKQFIVQLAAGCPPTEGSPICIPWK